MKQIIDCELIKNDKHIVGVMDINELSIIGIVNRDSPEKSFLCRYSISKGSCWEVCFKSGIVYKTEGSIRASSCQKAVISLLNMKCELFLFKDVNELLAWLIKPIEKTYEPLFNVTSNYKEMVMYAFQKGSSHIISGSSLGDTKFLIYYLIKKANNVVRIFAGNFEELFYDDERIKAVIQGAISRGVKFKLLFDQAQQENDLLNSSSVEHEVTIYDSPVRNHFLISDDKGYRLEEEYSGTKFDPYLIQSKAGFNSPDVAEGLIAHFNLISDNRLK